MKVVSTQQPLNVLFLCTGNSARSQMAEVILNRLGRGKFKSIQRRKPACRVRPSHGPTDASQCALRCVELRSKPWEEFARPDAPQPRFRLYRLRQRREGGLSRSGRVSL